MSYRSSTLLEVDTNQDSNMDGVYIDMCMDMVDGGH